MRKTLVLADVIPTSPRLLGLINSSSETHRLILRMLGVRSIRSWARTYIGGLISKFIIVDVIAAFVINITQFKNEESNLDGDAFDTDGERKNLVFGGSPMYRPFEFEEKWEDRLLFARTEPLRINNKPQPFDTTPFYEAIRHDETFDDLSDIKPKSLHKPIPDTAVEAIIFGIISYLPRFFGYTPMQKELLELYLCIYIWYLTQPLDSDAMSILFSARPETNMRKYITQTTGSILVQWMKLLYPKQWQYVFETSPEL